MRYWVVSEDTQEGLCRMVEEKLAAGWQLWGGVALTPEMSGLLYAQALVFPEPSARPAPAAPHDANNEGFRVRAWLLSAGAPTSLINAVHRGFAYEKSARLVGPDGLFFLDTLTLEQFRERCANPDYQILISGVGAGGRRRLRELCSVHVATEVGR